MIQLIQSTRRDGVMQQGEWRGGQKARSQRTALACCPGCGKLLSLGRHTIDADGTVTPSLVCPFRGCDFHEFVMLADWKA